MVRGIWGFNKHEETEKYINKRTQEGGTGLVAFGEMASCMNSATSGVDDEGLGRWTYMEFRGKDGHCTVVITGYVPCRNNKPDSGTSYQQLKRYYVNKKHSDVEPRKQWLEDFLKQLKAWKEEGKRLVVCLDTRMKTSMLTSLGDLTLTQKA